MSARSQISASQGRRLKSNPGFVLRPDAAIAWDRACEKFGKRVLITGALRSLETQTRIFNERYEPGWRSGADNRYWPGHGWYHRVRGAAAAVPGTSNHGSGDAVDVKTRRDDDDPPYAKAVVFTSWSDRDRTAFLKAAAEFGWDDAEGRRVNELWHLTYYPSKDRWRGKSYPPKPTSHTRATTALVNLRATPGGKVVRVLPKGFKFSVRNGVSKKVNGLWWVQTTSRNWVASKYTRKTNSKEGDLGSHWRVITAATHVYGGIGRKRGRLLHKGFVFTVVDGSGAKRGKTWWVKTTSGNWVRGSKTRKKG